MESNSRQPDHTLSPEQREHWEQHLAFSQRAAEYAMKMLGIEEPVTIDSTSRASSSLDKQERQLIYEALSTPILIGRKAIQLSSLSDIEIDVHLINSILDERAE